MNKHFEGAQKTLEDGGPDAVASRIKEADPTGTLNLESAVIRNMAVICARLAGAIF